MLDYGRGILPFRGFVNDSSVLAADAERTTNVVDGYFTATLTAGVGVRNWATIGVQLPVSSLSGSSVQIPGIYNDPQVGIPQGLNTQGFGDLSVHAKVRLLRVDHDPIGLAGLLRIGIPTGDGDAFGGEPGFSFWPTAIAEWRPVERLRLSGELGYRIVAGTGTEFPVEGRTEPRGIRESIALASATDATFHPANPRFTTYGDLITYGLGASWRLGSALDLSAEVYGTTIAGVRGSGSSSVEALGAVKLFVQAQSYLHLGLGGNLTRASFQAANLRVTVGFFYAPTIGDDDGDGIRDDIDQCRSEPEDYDGFVDADGCPDPDNDRDGIIDDLDECPRVAEDADGDDDRDGCPEGSSGDRDGDGVLDDADECPDVPEDRDGFEDEDGCPDLENDEDGILDADDLCPDDPEDPDDFQDLDGCPDPDNDEDRILDVDDNCPNDPETFNGYDDEDGCPDTGLVIVSYYDIEIREKVFFGENSTSVEPRRYSRVLDAIAATLIGNPQITLVEIQGHADPRERGDGSTHVAASRVRALTVGAELVSRGVDPRRLVVHGYGSACPYDPRTRRSRESNRRVEFHILQNDGQPSERVRYCPEAIYLVNGGPIEFEFRSAALTAEALERVAWIAERMAHSNTAMRIELHGHAARDEAVESAALTRLSRARAATVMDALVSLGVDRRHLQHIALGTTCSESRTPSENRRVSFAMASDRDGEEGPVRCSEGRDSFESLLRQ